MADRHFETTEIHADNASDAVGAVVPPIYTSTTFAYDSPTELTAGYRYGRMGEPTRDALESAIASLEGGDHAFAFASGMAAIDTVCSLLEPGDHVVAGNSLYAESHELFTKFYPRYGIDVSTVDTGDPDAIESAMTPSTAMVYLESPTNPLLHIADIETASTIAADHGAICVVDNTFASPYLQRPLELGADIVVESLTKYVGGHSDVIAGSVATDDDGLAEQIETRQYVRGAIPGPFECYLALRGSRTLSARMDRQCTTASAIASMLDEHPSVDRTYYPGLEHHPNHDIAARQMDAFGAMVSFELTGDSDTLAAFLDALEVFTLAESLGAVESLVEVPSLMTHRDLDAESLRSAGIPPGLIRLSVGTEHRDDLVADLERAIAVVDT